MGMSNLECLPEVAECIKASSASLKCLTLSLSMDLAHKSRKPVPVNPEVEDPSDTELDEDDLLNDPMPPTASTTQQQPATNEADIRKEKLAQESILARVFDLQSVAVEGKKIEQLCFNTARLAHMEDSTALAEKAKAVTLALLKIPIDLSKNPSVKGAYVDHFKMIRETADLYITQYAAQNKPSKDQPKAPGSSTKKSGLVSKTPKPLNPIAAGFKPMGSSPVPGSNIQDWDLSTMSSPTSPFPYPDFSPKEFVPGSTSSMSIPTWGKNKPIYTHEEMTQLIEGEALIKKHVTEQNSKELQVQAQAYWPPCDVLPYNASSPYNASPFSLPSNESHQDLYDYSKYAPPGVYHPSELSDYGYQSVYNEYPVNEAMVKAAKLCSPVIAKENKQSTLPKTPDQVDIIPVDAVDVSEGLTVPGGAFDPMSSSPPSSQQPFFAAGLPSGPVEEPMDVDMDHPDEETAELGEDQEFVAVSDDSEVPTPRKRAKLASKETAIPRIGETIGSSSSAPAEQSRAPRVIDPDRVMQSWIRANHGLQLEELSLEWVPLKASIVARALDLRVLSRVTFLEVGPQDAFWTLLSRLQTNSWDISFKSIHTDNVSHPFLRFLTTFEGLEELYMHERNGTKIEPDAIDAGSLTIRDIRKSVLKTHLSTLKRLMIKNEKNDRWDVDHKTVDLLAKEGKRLTELAISLNMKVYVRCSLCT